MRSADPIFRAFLFVAAGASATATAGCGGGGSGALGETPTLTGKISGWNRGQQPLQAYFSSSSTPIASSTIDASGNFSITLPTADPAKTKFTTVNHDPNEYKQGAGCTLTQQTDPFAYGLAQLGLGFTTGTMFHVVAESYSLPDGSTNDVLYDYIDRDWNQTIAINCPNSTTGDGHFNIDVHYVKGWNRMILNHTGTTAHKYYTGTDLDGAAWVNN